MNFLSAFRRFGMTACLTAGLASVVALPAFAEEISSRAPRAFAPATARPISGESPAPIRPAGNEPYLVARPTPPAFNPKFQLPESEGAWRLKWHGPGVATEIQQVAHEEIIGGQIVRPAAYDRLVQRNDAFSDPFGDRGISLQPSSPAPLYRQAEPPANEPSLAPLPSDSPLQPTPAPMPSEVSPRLPMPRGVDPAPMPPGLGENEPMELGPADRFDPFADPSARRTDCDHVYNQRNCCEDEERCRIARDYVQRNTIKNISLDITPRFKPDDPNMDEAAKRDQLSQAPSREWRNRDGELLADGRLVDYRWGRVIVEDESGEIQKIWPGELSDDDQCFLAAFWNLPTECSLGDVAYLGRHWMPLTMTWKASALCHKPLYFEEVQLERYGHTTGPFAEPFVSGAHFFLNIATVPYKMGINPPTECQYALGYYRPGSCAPWLLPPVPISFRGALYQTGAILGGIYALP